MSRHGNPPRARLDWRNGRSLRNGKPPGNCNAPSFVQFCHFKFWGRNEPANLPNCQTATGTTKLHICLLPLNPAPNSLSAPHLYHLSLLIDHLQLLFHLRPLQATAHNTCGVLKALLADLNAVTFPRPCDLEQVLIIMPSHCRTPQWRLALLGPLILGIFSTLAQSSAAVNVALKTSFDAAPYLVELL